MKNKLQLLFGILLVSLSSCVYSLFPIYTEDTLTFKAELLGKWASGNERDEYLLFEKVRANESIQVNEETHYTDSVIGENFALRSEDRVYLQINGRKVYDKDSIRARMQDIVETVESNKLEEGDGIFSKRKDFQLSGHNTSEKSYKMTVSSDGKIEVYLAHLVDIDGELFMDLFPAVEYSSNPFSENYFPVHTFMKIQVNGDLLDFTFFDLEKLNKLFESNLIRMRHENVDGQILITAQPKEIQKFLGKYSDDESVFDDTERYVRIAP